MPVRTANRPRSSARRRLLFVGLTVALVLLVVEGMSWLVLSVLVGRPVGWRAVAGYRDAVARDRDPTGGEEGPDAGEALPSWAAGVRELDALHPYLGFVARIPDDLTVTAPRFRPVAANLGFPFNLHELVNQPSPERVVVAVVGGSVARQIAGHGRPFPLLDTALEAIPRFQGRDVWVLNLALGGYKQPQQLMVLTYFLSLGAHFDVVINLDGFNEVSLPIRNNIASGVNPFYPSGWRYRLGGGSRAELEARGVAVVIDDTRTKLARACGAWPWRSSYTASLLWWLVDGRLRAEAGARQRAVMSDDGGELSLEQSGPKIEFGSPDEVVETLVGHWLRCSENLDRLARAHGFEYYHFLQPNQYDRGSKKLTAEERRLAYDPTSDFVELIGSGYPALRRAAPALEASGVAFVDLSGVFADQDETVYIDTCCHLNRRGIQMIVDRMAEVIAQPTGSSLAAN